MLLLRTRTPLARGFPAMRSFACRRHVFAAGTSKVATATPSLSRRTFLGLSAVIVSPSSTSALPASFRPSITVDGRETRVLVEQTTVGDPQRLGDSAGRLGAGEFRAVDESLALILGL